MYPYILKNSGLHYFDDFGILFTSIGRYNINDVEVYIIEKFNKNQSIDEVIDEIALELDIDERKKVEDIINEFIDSKPGVLSLRDTPNWAPIKTTGIKGKRIPTEFTISLTNKCNQKCVHCFKKCSVEGNNILSYDKVMSTLDYFKGKSKNVQLTGGEPMLHERFFDILDYCKNNFSTTVTTTGTLINSANVHKFKGIERIQLSLYSNEAKGHEAVTGIPKSFDKTINGIKELVKTGVSTAIATIITGDNIGNIESMINYAVSLGVDLLRFGILVPCGRGTKLKDKWGLTKAMIDDVKEILDKLSIKYKDRISVETWSEEKVGAGVDMNYKCLKCGAGLLKWIISETGIVKPCELLEDYVCSMGNINNESIETIIDNYNFDKMPDGLSKWEKELQKDNCTVLDICPQINSYYLEYCCTR